MKLVTKANDGAITFYEAKEFRYRTEKTSHGKEWVLLDSNDDFSIPIYVNEMDYIAIDDIVIKDVTWGNDVYFTMEKDKISFLELSEIYFKISGKRYINLERLKEDLEETAPWFSYSDNFYLYKEDPENV